jgi:hypothetical protein
MDIDTFFPEVRVSDDIKLLASTGKDGSNEPRKLQEDQSEQDTMPDFQKSSLQREEPVGPESAEHKEASAAAAPTQKKRNVKSNPIRLCSTTSKKFLGPFLKHGFEIKTT